MTTPVSETNFEDLNLLKRGKVRDIYDLGENLLMVARPLSLMTILMLMVLL